MKKFLAAAIGGAVGTLIYTGVVSTTHEPDWYRAAFVGFVIGIVAALLPSKKNTASLPKKAD